MAKKELIKSDFRRNPDKVKVNDWVFSNGNVGLVQGVAIDTEKMLQFFVLWNNEPPAVAVLAENLKKLNRPVSVGGINYTIDLDLLVLSPELQQRVKLDKSVIEEYAEAFKNHVKFPPITIWYRTDVEYKGTPLLHPAYLIDGFHRVEAAKIAGITELPFIRKQGTLREALLYSTSINSTHGLRRSNADKRKAVMTLLNDEEWNGWSNREIASHCGVSHQFVNNIRKSIWQPLPDTKLNNPDGSTDTKLNNLRKVTRGGKTYIQDTTNIGKSKVKETESDLPTSNPPTKRKYIKNGKEVEMEVSKAIQDPEIFPELPGTPLLDSLNNPDSKLPQEKQSLTKSGNNQTDNNDSTVIPNPDPEFDDYELKDSGFLPEYNYPEDNRYYPEDVIKDLWDDDDENVSEDSVNEDSLSEDSVSKDSVSNNKDKTENPNPTSTKRSKHNKPNNIKRPQKKEIVIKEGLNYFAGSLGSNCKWYLEVRKHIYEGLKIYQSQINAIDIERILSDFLIEKGILKSHPDDCTRFGEYDEKPSPINSLNSETRIKLEDIVEKHGIDAIFKKFEE